SATFDSKIKMWDLTGTGKKDRFPPITAEGAVTALRFTPDGKRLASKAYGVTDVVMRNALTGEILATVKDGGQMDGTLALSPDGKLAAVSYRKRLVVLDLDSGAKTHDWTLGEAINAAEFAPDGQHLVVASGNQTLIFRLSSRR